MLYLKIKYYMRALNWVENIIANIKKYMENRRHRNILLNNIDTPNRPAKYHSNYN